MANWTMKTEAKSLTIPKNSQQLWVTQLEEETQAKKIDTAAPEKGDVQEQKQNYRKEENKEQDHKDGQEAKQEEDQNNGQDEIREENHNDDQTTDDGQTEEEEDTPEFYSGNIILDVKMLNLCPGDTYQLTVNLTEKNRSNEKIVYSSSNKKVLTVNENGVIKALTYGEAIVTVSLGSAKATCKVAVSKEISITISAAGDCTLASDIKQPASVNFFSVYNKKKDPRYFFKNVKGIFEKDDLTIVNFEGTLSSRGKRVDKQWAFRGKPSYIKILQKGSVEAVAFANNHSRDYGVESYNDTMEIFQNAGIAYSTYGKPCVYEVKGIKIGMISIQEVGRPNCEKTLRSELKAIKKEKPDLLIVSFHWGKEGTSKITENQSKLAKIAIDEGGADLVLGHHPHVLQPIEKYKDAYIVYSLGNFCFGGNTNPVDKDTMIFQQTFTFRNDKLVPDDNVKIIPCSLSSNSKKNNYQPTPSKGSEKKRILKKINGYCKQFGISFDFDGKVKVK